jgi:N-acetylglutamate synthase-like GNAT family acetyltransferase
MTSVNIRAATQEDFAALAEVSRAADTMFAEVGLDLPPDDPLAEFHAADHVLLAEFAGPQPASPLGFAALMAMRESAHLAMLGVHPDRTRRGIGGTLLEAACSWARDQGHRAVTLTTFRDVPFNAPWYSRRGFVEVPAALLSEELAERHRVESAGAGVSAPRVVMRRPVSA